MEKPLVKPVVKKISVILTREPLIELRKYMKTKISEYSDSKQNCLDKLKPYNRRGFKDLNVNKTVQCKKTDRKEETIVFKDPTNLNKIHNVTYKECKVVLERLYPYALEKAREISEEKMKTLHKNTLTENLEKRSTHMPEKRPVYLEIANDNSKQNNDNDLYEFDELDSEDTSKVQQQVQKRKHKLKHISRVRKKKPKIQKNLVKRKKICITYDKAVEEILRKVLQKVNKDNLDFQTSTPTKQKSHFDVNMPSPLQEDNLSDMGDDNIHDHNVEVNESTFDDKENDSPNNNTSAFGSLYIPLQRNQRIQIISNILLDKSDYSSFFDEHLEPNANSTTLFSAKCYPWRFNENVKRNPHYLNIKKNALPALQQDMVLDYNQLNKLEQHFLKTPTRLENFKITPNPIEEPEYIEDINNKENNPRPSLFEDDFVPEVQPKLITDYFSKNKQKRTVLGPLIQNSNNIIQTTDLPESNTLDIATSHEEVLKPTKDVNSKKSSQNVVDQPEDTNLEPRLFEDDEPSHNLNEISKIYVPKTRKKKKILHHNVEEPHQDKPKREMSKADQVQLEKWAAKFNSLCEDIENYQLEID